MTHTGRLRGRGALAAAFALGIGIAWVATAGASALITGRQVKDGSIGARDLAPSLRAKLARKGPQGPQGPVGAQGPAGPFQTSLPSGQTMRGVYAVTGMGVSGAAQNGESAAVTFPFALAATPTPHFIAKGGSAIPECPGTAAAPQAAAGQLCVYEGGQFSNAAVTTVDPATQGTPGASRWGFILSSAPGSNGSSFSWNSHGTWAVTAP
ncbi:MAG: hypothetical protein U0Y82_05960 [Thermoleophilia bacterium]